MQSFTIVCTINLFYRNLQANHYIKSFYRTCYLPKPLTPVGTLEEEALKRKERLRNLRNKPSRPDSENNETDIEKQKLPKPVFRSYKPVDESLKDSALPQTKPADVTEKIQGHIEASRTENVIEEVDLVNLAPRKPDWDLKRDVAKKLEKLERRTERAIAELIRERLKKSGEDLAQVVSAATPERTTEEEDDD